MSPVNTAAWVNAEKAYPIEVKAAEYTAPSSGEVVVKVHAIALNPVDYARQDLGASLFSWTKYPAVFGSDVAGEIVELGPGASPRFTVGDRVLGLALGLTSNLAAEGAFQEYVILKEVAISHIPANVSYEQGAVIPLGISTAASALFQKDHLGLDLPKIPASSNNGETVLIWSGSSSVGANAIQLATAAGYEVFSTASPQNFDLVKNFGASHVFDYSSPTVVSDIIAAFKGKKSAGGFAIGREALEPVFDIITQVEGKKVVISANGPPKDVPSGITANAVFGSTLIQNEVGPAIFGDYLPRALANGALVPAPELEVVGKGLQSIQSGLEVLKKGVSARKLIITL